MFSKAGIIELHATMHERLDLLLRHVATVPDDLHHKLIPGFGHPSIWKQLVHIMTCEEGWVHDLQNKAFPGWREEDCPTMAAMLATKDRIREATRAYLEGLTEEQLNTTLAKRPVDWGGELRSPAFILLHVITHAFHHKGQVAAMLRIRRVSTTLRQMFAKFSEFFMCWGFLQKNSALGSPGSDDLQLGRPTVSPLLSFFKRISHFQS
jgi:uncharacterized damage-inducible protein DinB